MNLGNNKWLNKDDQARIKLPPTPLIKATAGNTEECNTIKIEMREDPAPAAS